jgi:DNA-binding CsgD family transcriptional regulator/tetratricopeptide (TPR) repeat protein
VLDGRFDAARHGNGSLVLLMGEAGAGKTSLVCRFCADVARAAGRSPDPRVFWSACDAMRTPRPLGPLADIAWTAGNELGELIHAETPPWRVFTTFLTMINTPPPTIVVIEDLHWADEATLDLIRFLARRIAGTPALVLATFRDDELAPDHPLRVVLGDLATAPAVRRLDVPPLSRDAVGALAAAGGMDADRLYEVTGGNPFFVTEVLSEPGRAVPPTVRDAVLARAARLGPLARRALDVAAVVPDQLDLPLLRAVAEVDEVVVEEWLHRGVMLSDNRGLGFRHELARTVIEEAIPAVRRRGIHARVLAHLAGRSGSDPARLAYHAEEAGDRDATVAHAPVAAQRAAALGAHRQAAAQLERALRCAERAPADVRAGLWQRLATEHAPSGRTVDAIDAAARALEQWRAVGDRAREAAVLARQAGYLWQESRPAEARAAIEAAMTLVDADPPGPATAVVYASQSLLHMLAREIPQALRTGRTAIELAETHDDAESLARALNAVGTAQWFAEPDLAVPTLRRALATSRQLGSDVAAASALMNLGSGAGEIRRYRDAERWLREAVDYSRERDLDTVRVYCIAWLARTRFEQGDWAAAERLAAEALAPAGRRPDRITSLVALTVLGRLRARRGEPDPAGPLDQAWEMAVQTADLQRLWPTAAARAEAAWLAGRTADVVGLVEETHRLATKLGHAWAIGELGYWLHLAGERDVPLSHRLRERGIRRIPRGPRRSTMDHPAGLTRREVEILRLLPIGLRNAEIAQRLHISPRTVDRHISSILGKLGVATRHEAAAKLPDLDPD